MRNTSGPCRPLCLLVLAATAAALAPCAAHARPTHPAEVRSLKLSSERDHTELDIAVNGPTRYALARLHAPERLVLDLDANLAARVRLPAAAGVVAAVRTARLPHGVRFVLQLNAPVHASSRWASSGTAGDLVVSLRTGTVARRSSAPAPRVANEPSPEPVVPARPPRPVLAAHAPVPSDRDVVIAVDAGHGGFDPGATGPGGTHEKDVVLAIARDLAARIDAESGMRAVLTRNRDEFLLLGERVQRAQAAHADLFVSVHADSIRERGVAGSSVYVLSERGATDEAARVLAERENAADLLGGISLSDKDRMLQSVLLDLRQSSTIVASITAAQDVLGALQSVGEVRKPQVQQAGFVVLKSPAFPSMLVETAYISNPHEEQRLRSVSHQQALADAVFGGLRAYLERNPPPGTRFARAHGATAVLAGTAATAVAP